jgi:hypothetical protein
VLTFNKPVLPKSIKAAYCHLQVEPFIPNPLRCFNCQKFGHGKSSCSHTAVCARCGNEGHCDTDCKEQPHCVNCSGPHPAFSRDCPEWIKQRAIVQLKTEKSISFGEAKQLYQQQTSHSVQTPKPGVSYASICKTCHSISTQTDLTWPLDSKIPIFTDSITSHQSTETQTNTNTASNQASATSTSISNIPHYSSTPKQKLQLNNTKPGPASSKQGPGKKPAKGSNNPISLFNRYGSLDSMDQEVELSPGKGPGGRKNR